MKRYEIMYIVSAPLDSAARTKLADSFHKIITDHEGTIDKIGEWDVKEFAYEINHMKRGYYVIVDATANNEGIHGSEHLARVDHNIVRYMIIKTQGEE